MTKYTLEWCQWESLLVLLPLSHYCWYYSLKDPVESRGVYYEVNQSKAYCVAVCSIKPPRNPPSEMISSLFANFLQPFIQGGCFVHHLTSFLRKTNQSCADSFILEVQVVVIGVGPKNSQPLDCKCKNAREARLTQTPEKYRIILKKLGTNYVGTPVKTLKITWRKWPEDRTTNWQHEEGDANRLERAGFGPMPSLFFTPTPWWPLALGTESQGVIVDFYPLQNGTPLQEHVASAVVCTS